MIRRAHTHDTTFKRHPQDGDLSMAMVKATLQFRRTTSCLYLAAEGSEELEYVATLSDVISVI